MNKDTLAIILLNWNNPDDTMDCVESLLVATENIDGCIFLADNGSEDHSLHKIKNTLHKMAVTFSFYQQRDRKSVV